MCGPTRGRDDKSPPGSASTISSIHGSMNSYFGSFSRGNVTSPKDSSLVGHCPTCAMQKGQRLVNPPQLGVHSS
jgi:hypothetical protein